MPCSDFYWAVYSWTTFPLEGTFSDSSAAFWYWVVFVASVLDGYKIKPSSYSNLCTDFAIRNLMRELCIRVPLDRECLVNN